MDAKVTACLYFLMIYCSELYSLLCHKHFNEKSIRMAFMCFRRKFFWYFYSNFRLITLYGNRSIGKRSKNSYLTEEFSSN